MNTCVYLRSVRQTKHYAFEFAKIPIPCIADSLAPEDCLSRRIHLIHGISLVGPAVTVKTTPGNFSVIRRAIETAETGDVVVIDAGKDTSGAVVDDLLVAYAEQKGIAGIVVDGAVRGTSVMRTLAIPVFAAGVTPRKPPVDSGDGMVNIAIVCGGTVVMPGDLVVGDSDGLMVISADDVPDILRQARSRADDTRRTFSALSIAE